MTSNKLIKVTFILPTLSAGGAERIFSFLAQNIDKSRFEPTLLIIGKSNEKAYDVNDIKILYLEKSRVLRSIPSLFMYLKKSKPDIVLSVISHLNTVVAYLSIFFPNIKFIARESTILSVDSSFFNHSGRKGIFGILAENRFNYFDRIVCQSQDMLDDMKNNFDVKDSKLILINNPITNVFELKKNDNKENVLSLITVGRLSKEKGIPRLLEILSELTIPFHYTLIGAGSEKELIFSLIKKYGLEQKITYIPFTKNVSKFLQKNDFFLQGSYFEGFPNCLVESCVVGTPVIAFDVPGGTKDIIIDNVNGYLVNDKESFLQKLHQKKTWNIQEIRDSVLTKFNKRKIICEYEQLFLNVLKPH